MKIVAITLFLFCGLSAYSQKGIMGTITDVQGKPLADVKIKVKSTDIHTFSDEDGLYSIVLPEGKKTLIFELEHYEQESVEVEGEVVDVCLKDAMAYLFEMSMEQLLEMKVVTAGKTTQKVADIPASVVIIERAEIEKYGYQSLFEVLMNVPGFYKHDDYHDVSFGVRGFFSNAYNRAFVLLVNGVQQVQPFFSRNSDAVTTIQIESIDRIEIIRGPMTVMYGVNAFFGAINIITNEKVGGVGYSNVTAGYGTDNTYRLNVQAEIGEGDRHTSISAGYYHTDGRDIPFSPILDSVVNYAGVYQKNRNMDGFFLRNSHYFNMSSKVGDFYCNLSFDETDRNHIDFFAPVLDTVKSNYQNRIFRGNLGYRKDIGEKFTVDGRVDLISSSRHQNFRLAVVTPIRLDYARVWSKTTRWSGELTMLYRPITDMLITLGGKGTVSEYEYTIDVDKLLFNHSYDPDRAIWETSLYSQIDYQISDMLLFVAGVRFEKQEKYKMTNSYFEPPNEFRQLHYWYDIDDIYTIPRFAMVYKPTEKSSLKLMYGEALSRSSFAENTYLTNDVHPTLKPQHISTTEINFTAALGEKIGLSSSVFYNHLTDLIVYASFLDRETSRVLFVPNNSGKMATYGTELQFQFMPSDRFVLDMALSMHWTKDKSIDKAAAYSPNLLGYFKGGYSVTDNISFAVTANYVGEMETFWVNSDESVGSDGSRFYKTTPDYLLLNANVRYDDILGTGMYFNLHGTNLLNQDIFYGPTPDNSTFLGNGTYDRGVGVFCSLGVKF